MLKKKRCHIKTNHIRELPGGPVVRTWCFHCWGPGSIPGQGTKILQAMWHGQKKKKSLDAHCPMTYHFQPCSLKTPEWHSIKNYQSSQVIPDAQVKSSYFFIVFCMLTSNIRKYTIKFQSIISSSKGVGSGQEEVGYGGFS